MSYPKNDVEWWSMLEAEKVNIRKLVVDWHPRSNDYCNAHGMKITAGRAEKIAEVVRKGATKSGPIDVGTVFDKALGDKDREMVDLLSKTWWGLPESIEVRSLPGFGLLCDLCSEAHVLFEDDE